MMEQENHKLLPYGALGRYLLLMLFVLVGPQVTSLKAEGI
jgi:hypothetical protein